MIPLAANVPLTLCSVVIRRFIDSYTGRLPLAVATSTVPTASTVALFSGALVCLYHQLRKGTLVKIGLGKKVSSMIRNSRHTIQRRVKNNSWFLRNIDSCRRKCTEAVLKIALPANDDSLEHIQAETGSVERRIVDETNSLPIFNRCPAESRRSVKHFNEPPVEKLYSNDSFDSNNYSSQDVRVADTKREEPRRRKSSGHVINPMQRPVTRNFRKALGGKDSCGDGRKLTSKKRKKSDHITNEAEDEPYIIDLSKSEDRNELSRKSPHKLRTAEGSTPAKLSVRRHSERVKSKGKAQKITRKTRSGRVYVYRLP